ncbi:MAG: acetylornithine/N-succinyldiaminopimelate aminotransferase [Thermoplasmata archaeon]|nr:acetylornithine/N-succinyldiaminopimelate aminotransferase [Thermoplasmata archaeon]
MDLKTRWERALAPTYATPTLQIDRGEGCYLFDAQGKRYLDFIAGIAVCSTGHAHPEVVAAISRQAQKLMHVSNLYATENVMRFAERLTAITGYDRAFFCNSGAEANEAALKIARRHAHAKAHPEAVVIALDQSFHGRTTATVTLTGQPKYQKDFGPLPEGIVHVPANDIVALEMAFARQPVAAVFLEFVQGEGGVRALKPEFVQAVQRLCMLNDALLVADEVQTGVGRTGKFLASQHFGVRPDITTLAKGIASGFPVGAALLNARAAALLHPGDHGSTFGGNPLGAAAGLATLDVLQRERLLDNASVQGDYLRTQVKARVPGVKETRGLGLLVGVELEQPIAKQVKVDAEAAGLLVNAIGDHVLRLAPPLIVTGQQVDDAVAILEKVVSRRLS